MGSGVSDSGRVRRFLADYGPLVIVAVALALAAVGVTLAFVGDLALAETWLQRYGFAALFAILVLEGSMLLYFAPSESLAPLGMAFLADSTGDGVAVVLTMVAGATVGQYLLFLVAKRAGREYLLEKPWFRVSEDLLDRFDAWFDRWGVFAVPLSNALPFTRGMATVPAGLAEMRDRNFLVLSAAGSLVFQSLWALLYVYGADYLPDLPDLPF